jgi:hypothetical protein
MATLADIQNKIYSLTGTDSTSYSNANMLIDLNLWYQKVVSMILDSQDETDYDDPNQTSYPIFKALLTTNRDIVIPASLKMLKIRTVSICYDGANIYRATPYDIAEGNLPVVDAANTAAQLRVDANMSRTSPRFDIRFGSLWTYPMANSTDVAAGAYLIAEFFRQPVEFTATDLTTGTATPGFDASFHHILSYGPAMEYATAKSLPQLKMITAELSDFEVRLRKQYSSKQLDRRYALSSDYQSYK